MTRDDILTSAHFYREGLRREARRRAKRYPDAAAQLHRLADGVDRQITEIKCGPLFADLTDLTPIPVGVEVWSDKRLGNFG